MELKFCKICKIVSTCYIKKRDVKIRGISLKIFPLLVFKLVFNIKILSVSLRFMRFIVGESRFTSDLRERNKFPTNQKEMAIFLLSLSLSLSRMDDYPSNCSRRNIYHRFHRLVFFSIMGNLVKYFIILLSN